jgi:ferrous iron transport protein A
LKSLADVSVGQQGRVLRVEGGDGVSIRLLEMGLIPGVPFAVVGVAPLGDPLELEIRGYRLSVRKSEAARVQVELTAAASS